jgi:stage V sporulation protein D (sporulation-specific penicillin-binding protein)
MEDPEYLVLVALDTPSRETGIYISGGVMAAPTVGAVMADILPYLGVAQTFAEEDPAGRQIVMEDLTGLTETEACTIIKNQGLTSRNIGTAERVTAQIPAPGSAIPGNSQVILYFGDEPKQRTAAVPDFAGMNRQQAHDAAGALGLYILVTGNTELSPNVTVTAQSEPKDTEVPVGTTITLTFTDTKAAD